MRLTVLVRLVCGCHEDLAASIRLRVAKGDGLAVGHERAIQASCQFFLARRLSRACDTEGFKLVGLGIVIDEQPAVVFLEHNRFLRRNISTRRARSWAMCIQQQDSHLRTRYHLHPTTDQHPHSYRTKSQLTSLISGALFPSSTRTPLFVGTAPP